MNTRAYSLTLIGAGLIALVGLSGVADSKDYLKGDRPQQRGYSQAVITEGGRIVWLAGQTATVDDNGRSLASDFDGQVRQLFKNLDRTLQKAGGKLSDMVQMTVFITDVRYGDRLTQIRREVFGDNFPGSALITITALAVPDAKLEIQGYAVIGGKCKFPKRAGGRRIGFLANAPESAVRNGRCLPGDGPVDSVTRSDLAVLRDGRDGQCARAASWLTPGSLQRPPQTLDAPFQRASFLRRKNRLHHRHDAL